MLQDEAGGSALVALCIFAVIKGERHRTGNKLPPLGETSGVSRTRRQCPRAGGWQAAMRVPGSRAMPWGQLVLQRRGAWEDRASCWSSCCVGSPLHTQRPYPLLSPRESLLKSVRSPAKPRTEYSSQHDSHHNRFINPGEISQMQIYICI